MMGGQIVPTHAMTKQLPLSAVDPTIPCLYIYVWGMEKAYMSINRCQSQVRIPPMTRGIFCDSAPIRPVVATPETPNDRRYPRNPPGISSGLQREAPPRMSRRGYRTMFRSESFPS